MSEKYVTREGVEIEEVYIDKSVGVVRFDVVGNENSVLMFKTQFDSLFRPASEPSEFVSVKRTLVQAAIDLLKVDRRTTTATLLERSLTPKAEECQHERVSFGGPETRERIGDAYDVSKTVECRDCGMIRERGWTNDWQKPEASK